MSALLVGCARVSAHDHELTAQTQRAGSAGGSVERTESITG